MSLKHKEYKEANIRFLEENLSEEGVMECLAVCSIK